MRVSILDSSLVSVKRIICHPDEDLDVYLKLEDTAIITPEILSNITLEVVFACLIVSNKNIIVKSKFNDSIKSVMHKCGFSMCESTSPIHQEFSIVENSTVWISPIELPAFSRSSTDKNILLCNIFKHFENSLFPTYHGKALSCSYYVVSVLTSKLTDNKYQLAKLPIHIQISFKPNRDTSISDTETQFENDSCFLPFIEDCATPKNNSVSGDLVSHEFDSNGELFIHDDFVVMPPDNSLKKRFIIEKDSNIVCELEVMQPRIRLGNQIYGVIDFSRSSVNCCMYQISLSYREVVNDQLTKSKKHVSSYEFIQLSSFTNIVNNTVTTDFLLGTNPTSLCSFRSNIVSIEYFLILKMYTYSKDSKKAIWVPFLCPFSAVETTYPKLPHESLGLVSCTIPIVITPP